MKVLVTGLEGQLALSLAERSSAYPDIDLVRVGRPALDFEDPSTIVPMIRAHEPDVVVNAAAYTAVDQAEDEPERAFQVNAVAAEKIASAASDAGAGIIQVSTDYVFDGLLRRPYRPDDEPRPLGVYGRSKLQGEELVRQANPRHLIVRTAWVYSPFGKNFLKTMLALGATQHEVRVVDDQIGNPSSALDLADGIMCAIRSWEIDPTKGLGSICHLAGSGSCSWFEFAHHIMAERRRRSLQAADVVPISTGEWPTRAPRPANSVLDSSNFADVFGFTMPKWQTSTENVIQRLLA